MIYSGRALSLLIVSVTLVACSDDDPGDPGGSGGKGSGGEDSSESGGAASGGGTSGGSGTGGKASGGSSSGGGSSASGGEGNASSGGASGMTLEDYLDLAEDRCTVSYVKAYANFGELEEIGDGVGDPISSRLVDGADSEIDGIEMIVRDDRLDGHHELSWELPVTDGETKAVKGFLQYTHEKVFSKCFEGIARIRVDGVDGQFYVYASDKLFYADEDGTCLPMAETGYIWGCISDRF